MKRFAALALLGVAIGLCLVNSVPVNAQRQSPARTSTLQQRTIQLVSSINADGSPGYQGPREVYVTRSSGPVPGGERVSITSPGVSTLTINLDYDPDATFLGAGLSNADITNMKAAMAYAALQFTSRFKDPINVNIGVTATNDPNTLGLSNSNLSNFSYAQIRAAMVADSKSTDDATVLAAGGSVPAADPNPGARYWVTHAQAKALGLAADDTTARSDGTFTFGGTFGYTYDSANRAVGGKIDFIGVAMHELSEIMGRIGLMADPQFNPANSFMQMDLFHYTGAGTRGLNNGAGRSFSINNGTNLLMAFNNASLPAGGDLQDWASGTNDAFNAFSATSVLNALSAVDLRVMDVIGYDPTITTAAEVTISGRVVNSFGTGVRNARVTIADSRGHTFVAVTNSLGYYGFTGVPSGDVYLATASAKAVTFAPRIVSVNDAVADLNFSPQ